MVTIQSTGWEQQSKLKTSAGPLSGFVDGVVPLFLVLLDTP